MSCWKCGGKLTEKPYGLYCRKCGVYRRIRHHIKPLFCTKDVKHGPYNNQAIVKFLEAFDLEPDRLYHFGKLGLLTGMEFGKGVFNAFMECKLQDEEQD